MIEYTVYNEKSQSFLESKRFEKDPNRGDIVNNNNVLYFVKECRFASPLNPMIIVWPAILSFPDDFLDKSLLYDWLRAHLRDMTIEVSNNEGQAIKGKVAELYIDLMPDCISKLKVLQLENNLQPIPIIIYLGQFTKIELVNNS